MTNDHAGNFFPAASRCPHELECVGPLDGGGKWTCGLSQLVQKENYVINSFGMLHALPNSLFKFSTLHPERDLESFWEATILQTTKHCRIWGFNPLLRHYALRDPSPARFSPRQLHHEHPTRFDGQTRHPQTHTVLHPRNPHSAHSFIDILTINIPNIERSTLAAPVRPYVGSGRPLPSGQLIVELHVRGVGFAKFLEWWTLLESAGLRPVAREVDLVGMNYLSNGKAEDVRVCFLCDFYCRRLWVDSIRF